MTYFYAQLFAMDTEIRAMFPAAMDVQRRRFFEALGRIADAQQSQAGRDRLVPYLQELGRAHRKFGVRERHYEVFRRALLATLQRFAAPRWNETAKHAWEVAYNRAATIMIEAAKDDAAESPAWWMATVTGIELRGPDIAVLSLQPEQPLNYFPGQHISVQTPHWPRLWRTYSIANGPAGRRAAPPARARGYRRAGQSGARAPGPGRHREIVLYYGARRHQDLYDLAVLQEMALLYPWLQVIPGGVGRAGSRPRHDVRHGPRTGRQGHLGRPGDLHQRPRPHDRQDRTGAAGTRRPRRFIHYDLDPKASQGL